MLTVNALIVLFLLLLNGIFAMSEMALVSARRGRLQQMAQEGSAGAARALKLLDDPTEFLSTVQVGITLVGIFAGAFGASAFAEPLAEQLRPLPMVGAHADNLAFALVVVVITYLSLILGELVPKRFALTRPEAVAAAVAPMMALLARIGTPVVWILRVSTNALTRLFGGNTESRTTVTEEEVKAMIAEGTQTGVFEEKEREMIEAVLRIADRNVRSLMVPRPDTVWLDTEDDAGAVLDEIRRSGHSRFPVSREDVDDVVGVVQAKDLLEQYRQTGTVDLTAAAREALFVNETMPALKLLERFRTSNLHMAIVLDEYGSFEGIVTPTDILAAIAGSLPEQAGESFEAVQRDDGSWLLDAGLPIDEVERHLDGVGLPRERDYETLAGFILDRVEHIPDVGESLTWGDWRFEVVDLDGRRIDKVLASDLRMADAAQAAVQS
ncbi:hemolysin family protein [Aurantimonas sp. MSK8Z-1]|uniref:hemolysin family protein n=1 Tax=Mangrovibrevibacter kandeliae TaxID=2968473 RepID=UPI002118994C|nr:hemolysin family protein [Aurantimonas sp. MSK8Z-1]MCW4113571.1 hemolysin family protein [Aurantimonas sp. MSK8Z-1]